MGTVDKLSSEQIREFKVVFDVYDKNKEGKIPTNQLGTVMRCLGVNPTDEELRSWIHETDVDCVGSISFTQDFLPLMARKLYDIDDEDELCAAFEPFDLDGSGLIACTEFRHIMKVLGQKSKDEDIDRMLELVGADDNGMIDYRAFVHTILHQYSLTDLRAEL
mmetsp:Transcript_50309/g.146215  ORF Transcript_50309/g.146215 Transcript_50309/m.146215 type:complete len:163 (-) Transcript_50309:85-573(-)